jgi:hypothetical protein
MRPRALLGRRFRRIEMTLDRRRHLVGHGRLHLRASAGHDREHLELGDPGQRILAPG